MKNLSIIIFLIASMSIFAQNTYVPDDNFEQALIDLGYDTGPLDDYVPTANISGVTSLNVNYKSISNLIGIEDFIALTDLSCWHNEISSIDLSQNTELTNLRCYSNQLTSLDVTQNTLLTILNCANNQLSSINLSQNTALIDLKCLYNQLISIDLSQNTVLTDLYCSNNQLTSLNLSQNIDLINLSCGNNQISNLELSQNNVQELICWFNNLSSLDLSQNINLSILYCSYNQLINLDVRNGNNANISEFNAYSNPYLSCIFVDDKDASYLSNWGKDATATFVETQEECDALGVNNIIIDTDFAIYPNPVKENFSIQANNEIETVKIYDVFGKLLKVYGEQETYSVSDLATGVYLIYVQSKAGFSISKLIIE